MGANSRILWEIYSRLLADPGMEHSYLQDGWPGAGCHVSCDLVIPS